MTLQDFSPVMVCAASLAKIKSFSFAVESCLLVFAANADKLYKIEFSFLPNRKVGFVTQLVLFMGTEEKIELARVAFAFGID